MFNIRYMLQAHLTANSARWFSLLYGHPARHRLRATRLEWQKTSNVRPSLAAYMCLSSRLRLAWSGYKPIWCDLKKLWIHIIPCSVAMQKQRLWPEARERARSPSPACAIVQTEAFTDTYLHNLAFPRIQVETITVVRRIDLFDEQNNLLTSLGECSRPALSFPSSIVHSPSRPGLRRRLAFWCLEFPTYPFHPPPPSHSRFQFFFALGLILYNLHTATTVTGRVICIGREAQNLFSSV